MRCVLCGERIDMQTLGDVIRDQTNTKEVIAQANILMEMGYRKKDAFCQECFWK